MDLERYRVPASVRDGVVIELPRSKDAKFLVALPSEYNRAFTAAVQSALLAGGEMEIDEAGKPKMNMAKVDFQKFQDARIEAFLQHCLLEFPDGITREKLAGEYWPALKALFDRASDMAADEKLAAETITKKSRA